jgi:formaldehyde-activating enzyme involved in methanogenesis
MIFKTKRWKLISILSGVTLVVAVTGVSLFVGTSVARAAPLTANDLQAITQSSTGPGLLGEGYLTHGGWGRGLGGSIDYQQLLADALGISVDQLQAAYETARTAAINQAVKEGLITQEQADEMLVWGGLGRRGFDFFGFGRHPKGVSSSTIDEEALLAQALNITVDQLQAARDKANEAAIAQAVEQGIITQEQADQMLSQQKLQSYLNRDVLLAKALGMTTEELRAAYAEGKNLSTLMSERGLDAATVREKLITAYNDALAQAVKDGVITQEQADQMQNGRGWNFGFFGGPFGPGMRGGFRGHGDFENRGQRAPNTDDTGGASLRHPGRVFQGGSAL